MNQIQISRVKAEELESLQSIARQTFRETFASGNTEENMRKYLDENLSLERLRAEFDAPGSEFHFAKLDGEVIGYLKLNHGQNQTELQDERAVEIERIYVLQAYHGKQVGQLLYAKAIEIARAAGADYVWLGVWEENPRAIQFYKKNGFVEFDRHIFQLGDDAQTDIMMRLELRD